MILDTLHMNTGTQEYKATRLQGHLIQHTFIICTMRARKDIFFRGLVLCIRTYE
jgi:hypothetical protein